MNYINILIPELPESIHQATITNWYKKIGDIIKPDEVLLDIETEKVVLEIPSISAGILHNIIQPVGSIVHSQQIVGYIKKQIFSLTDNIKSHIPSNTNPKINNNIPNTYNTTHHVSPSIRRLYAKKNITQEKSNDNFIKNIPNNQHINNAHQENIKIIPMSAIRKQIAKKLINTQNKTAMLTTFNEVNMQSIINTRNKYCHIFQEMHNIKLGFMSFFIKSVIESLKIFPIIHAKIENDNIIYHKYFDINIAVSTNRGLITPVIKNVDRMSMADIEKKIQKFITKGNEGKLKLSDLIGGNFTITNGGVFGSLLSTPMINFPQSAILGIHAIQDRAIVINKKIQIAPMIYLALSYDHRLIDGKEAIGFLKTIKNMLEDFSRILLNI